MNTKKEYYLDRYKNKIDKVKRYSWGIVNNPGEFCEIKKDELIVNHEYQRTRINKTRIYEFAANWDWMRCGALIVAIKNNQWAVIDGQHRKLAADLRSDIIKLPCMVFDIEHIKDEARGFVDINSNKTAVSGFDKFKALIVAEDANAVGLNKLFYNTGYTPGNSSGNKMIQCLMTIWRYYNSDFKTVEKLWPLIISVHYDCQITDSVFRAICGVYKTAIKKGIDITNDPLKSVLIRIGGLRIATEIRKEKLIVGGGLRTEINTLIKILNKTHRVNKYKLPVT